MSTLFVVMTPRGTCEASLNYKEEDLEPGERYEPVAIRNGENGWFYWVNAIAHLLPPETPVYPWDNTAQGIFTIGDIINEMENNMP